jgi:hypothetical protein
MIDVLYGNVDYHLKRFARLRECPAGSTDRCNIF